MGKLILLRHGQSLWNKTNRFTGWVDVDLSPEGQHEARAAGIKLKKFKIDRIFTSVLIRAINTMKLVIESAGWDVSQIQIYENQALNERHYGSLQGQNKDEARKQFGVDQVEIWRRSYEAKPPEGESLKDTCLRVIPYYKQYIEPCLAKGETILVVAHGNSLRGLIKEIEHIDDKEVNQVEIPTGVPMIYDIDENANIREL